MPWRVLVATGVLLDSNGFARDVYRVHHLEPDSCFLRPFRLFRRPSYMQYGAISGSGF